jgi:hypothetical protein
VFPLVRKGLLHDPRAGFIGNSDGTVFFQCFLDGREALSTQHPKVRAFFARAPDVNVDGWRRGRIVSRPLLGVPLSKFVCSHVYDPPGWTGCGCRSLRKHDRR